MKKKFFIVATMLLVMSVGVFAKNVVQIMTSCGIPAYIDTDRTTLENTLKQVMEIDAILCGD